MQPKGVIFSGGPASVTDEGARERPRECSTPACRSLPSATAADLALQLGARSRAVTPRVRAAADVEIKEPSALVSGRLGDRRRYPVWMSHGDRVTELPPGFKGGRDLGRMRRSPSR